MQLSLILPGLIWPDPGAHEALSQLPCPALATLLGRGRLQRRPGAPAETALAAAFGLTSPLPAGALRLLGEDAPPAEPGEADWLCADPVHLHFAQETVALAELGAAAPRVAEAGAMAARLQAQFTDLGRFHVAGPTRWYLQLSAPVPLQFCPLADVSGRPVAYFPPEGDASAQRLWARYANELQVACHNDPLNVERESAGLPAINSLWLWGAGRLPQRLTAPAERMYGDEPLTRGLIRASGASPLEPAALTELLNMAARRAPKRRERLWAQLTSLLAPQQARDFDAWCAALLALEAGVFAPAWTALRRGSLACVTLVSPCDGAQLVLQVEARARWRFWRRAADLGAALGPAAAAPNRSASR